MKKILLLITSFFILIHISSCAGYKPIFDSTNLNFEIAKHTINGEKKLGNKIYSKLYGVSNLNKNNVASKSIEISINVSKNKVATIKNNAGKILEYRINISTNIKCLVIRFRFKPQNESIYYIINIDKISISF